jgi:L-serine dehydratase
MISAFDLFKIGIGPSSSHTVGPMVAARRYRERVLGWPRAARVSAEVFGSLAWTGRGHGTDTAIFLGLLGHEPATVDPDLVAEYVLRLRESKRIGLNAGPRFDPATDLTFNLKELLSRHTNGMRFRAYADDGAIIDESLFYSIGGGFVVEPQNEGREPQVAEPEPFETAAHLLAASKRAQRTIAEIQMANECALRPAAEIERGLDEIIATMFACIDRGLRMDGQLPGGLKVRRRAKGLYDSLSSRKTWNMRPAHEVVDWISLYALAVNEENAAGGRVVTAPTNGAAGIVPAVLRYVRDFCPEWSPETARTFLLTATAIGAIIKNRASISGAEVGCQGEVGSAAAMAAAGLAAALGGSSEQITNAAEIAMEHHLGLSCDPVGGLVQIPCIERNAVGANKAVVAASLSLHGDGTHRVSLDEVIETMRQTGADMQTKYKETSQGGLAVNVAAC